MPPPAISNCQQVRGRRTPPLAYRWRHDPHRNKPPDRGLPPQLYVEITIRSHRMHLCRPECFLIPKPRLPLFTDTER